MWGLSSHDGFGENQNYLGYHLLPLMFRAMASLVVKFSALIFRKSYVFLNLMGFSRVCHYSISKDKRG